MPVKPQGLYTDISNFYDENPENARRNIELEIQKLRGAIRSLESRCNMLAPISRLPPEILSQIFIFYASSMFNPIKPLQWIKVTHVSRHWRATAIDCPRLWSDIITKYPKWTEEMLKRSKMTGLVLNISSVCMVMTPKVLEAIQLVLQHITRIMHLKIFDFRNAIDKLIADSPIDAPLLRSLSLSIGLAAYRFDENVTLPENLFSGDTSCLQRLDLDGCNPTWSSPMFNGLTVLHIRYVHPLKRPTTSQLIEILEKMPALESLHLQETLPPVAHKTFTKSDHIINLSCLTHIAVVSTVPECTNLFNHITFPRDVAYSFRTRGTETTGHDFSTILNAIHNSETPETPIRTLHVRFEHHPITTLTIEGWSDIFDYHCMHIFEPLVELSLSWQRHNVKAFKSVITSAYEVLPLAHLENLHLSQIESIKPKTWVRLFGSLPKIRLIHLLGGSVETFISALKQKSVSDEKTQPTPSERESSPLGCNSGIPTIYFPNLQILTIEEAKFDCEDLRDLLIERCKQKVKLQELFLVSCGDLVEDKVNSLREAVVNLTWGYIVHSDYDSD